MRCHNQLSCLQAAADRLVEAVRAAYAASLPRHCALTHHDGGGGRIKSINLPLHLVSGSKQFVCKLCAVHVLQRRCSG